MPFLLAERARRSAALCGAVLLCAGLAGCGAAANNETLSTSTSFAMSTLIEQQVYGSRAQDAMRDVNAAIQRWDKQMSRFEADGDIGRINAGAGGGVSVSTETAQYIQQTLALSAQSEGSFAISIEPVTAAWGITTDSPRVPPAEELAGLLALVDDTAVQVSGNMVTLPQPGMGLDLGGIAKGTVCDIARDIYDEYGISGALLSIGGNVYAHGQKPDGSPFRIAFNDPQREGSSYIASFEMQNASIAMSGGYERFFEEDGKRYIHIIDPATGAPVESDILSVGVISENGTEADFWSTTLFAWGKERALEHMRAGGCAVLLDYDKTLYISESLRDSFELHVPEEEYRVEFVPGG